MQIMNTLSRPAGQTPNPKPVPKKIGPLIFYPNPPIGPYFDTQTLTFSGRRAGPPMITSTKNREGREKIRVLHKRKGKEFG